MIKEKITRKTGVSENGSVGKQTDWNMEKQEDKHKRKKKKNRITRERFKAHITYWLTREGQ